jgi:hypothetical protein
MDKLTREQAQLIHAYLLNQFPWLRSDDEEMPAGSDVIEQLATIANVLAEVAK